MATKKKLIKTRKAARWTLKRVVAPTAKWAGGKILKPGATGAASTLRTSFRIARSKHEREKALDRFYAKMNRRPVGWTGQKGNDEWEDIRRRRRKRKNAGNFACMRCGIVRKMADGYGHTCATCPKCDEVLHAKRVHECVKATPRPKPKPPPRQPRSSPPPSTNPNRGARIVRANTSAERFAQLPDADPDTFEELEALINDAAGGFNRLSMEITELAERLGLHHAVLDGLHALADKVSDLAEPARDVRRVARVVYADHIVAANQDVPVPADKPNYFRAS